MLLLLFWNRNVGGNVRDGITGLGGSLMSKPREFAHLIKNKFGSADNINQLSSSEYWSTIDVPIDYYAISVLYRSFFVLFSFRFLLFKIIISTLLYITNNTLTQIQINAHTSQCHYSHACLALLRTICYYVCRTM